MTPLSTLTEEQVQELAKQIADAVRPVGRDWSRPLQFVIGVIAVVSFVFSAGLNWSRLGALEERQNLNSQRLDELDKQQRALTGTLADQRADIREIGVRLGAIAADLTEIKGHLNARR